MISPAKVEEVRQLIERGNLSQREIARVAQVHRGTVRAIAFGKRPDYPFDPPDDDTINYGSPPVRCPGCGGLVYAPCRLCRMRAVQARQRILARLRRSDARIAALLHRNGECQREVA